MLMLAGCGLAVLAVAGEAAGGVHAGTSTTQAGKAPAKAPAPVTRRTPPAALQLSSGWEFIADPHNVGLRDHWATGGADHLHWTGVSIPDDFNPIVSNTGYKGTTWWYRVKFMGPAALVDRSWSLAFDEVRRNATVWLNGRKLGTNTDPYAPFSLAATGLKPSAENELVVRVDNIKGKGAFPEDWWNWGGIVQPVSLQPVGRLELQNLAVMPEVGCDYRCGHLLVQGTLQNLSATPLRPDIGLAATSPSGVKLNAQHRMATIEPGKSETVDFKVLVKAPPALWSPSRPALYKVQVSTSVGSTVEQSNSMQVGFRNVQVKGGILYLNGKRLWLHGAAIQEDVDGRGAALTDGDIDTIVSELRSVGANITRAHYLLSQRMLDALDQAGIMVWEQPPVDHADGVLKTASGRKRALGLLQATVDGYRSHPSVIVDSVGNELSPTPSKAPGTLSYLQQAIPLARALDPVAPVGLDIYCYPGYPAQSIYTKVDVLGISDYFGWYAGTPGHSIADFSGLEPFLQETHSRYPNQALAVSEFGAESLYDGSASTKGTYEFQSDYLQETFDALDQMPFMNGAIYWTLREFAVNPGWVGGADLPADDPPDGIHHKGLIAYDGTEKPAFSVAAQLFADPPPFVH
jgi:beta-glucuronidase